MIEFEEPIGDGSGYTTGWNQSPAACVDVKAFAMQRTREMLAGSRLRRQMAVAAFPLRVMRAAADLNKLCELAAIGAPLSADTFAAMDYLEMQIRDCFRDTFGVELG